VKKTLPGGNWMIIKKKRWALSINMLLFAVLMLCGSFSIKGDTFGTGPAAPGPADLSENDDDNEKAIRLFIGERETVLKALSSLNISASAGFSGHDAKNNNLYQLGLGVAVSKEMYPGEFRFRTGTSLVIQDSQLVENVTTMSLSYEHYLLSWLETYGFVDRYSNTFLNLNYRYEIGGGFKAEMHLGKDKWKPRNDKSHRILKKYRKYIDYLQNLAKSRKDSDKEMDTLDLLQRLMELEHRESGVIEFSRKKRSLLTVAMAVSAFSELEKPDNLWGLPDNLLKERQHFRLSLRPSFVLRPSRMITLRGYFYYKHPLFKKNNSNDPGHYRTDTILSAILNFSGDKSWTRNVSLVFEYQRHYENNPFGLKDVANQGLGISMDLIQDTHDEFMIKLNVEF
jgi:hypothetical protein